METSYKGFGTGVWIRDKLLAAGAKGVVVADLHKERKQMWRELGLPYKGGTYHSFVKLFHWFKQLGWVEKTEKQEPSMGRGTGKELNPDVPRTYYRITPAGREASIYDWSDPIRSATNGKWAQRSSYIPTGKPPGRPKKSFK